MRVKDLEQNDAAYECRAVRYTEKMFDNFLSPLGISEEDEQEEDAYVDTLRRLSNELFARMLELIEIHATDHQRRVMWCILNHRNLKQASQMLGINRTGVHHALYGCPHVYPDGTKKKHGGIVAKLKLLSSKDDECLKLIAHIEALKKEYTGTSV